jgi:hypothetical protein
MNMGGGQYLLSAVIGGVLNAGTVPASRFVRIFNSGVNAAPVNIGAAVIPIASVNLGNVKADDYFFWSLYMSASLASLPSTLSTFVILTGTAQASAYRIAYPSLYVDDSTWVDVGHNRAVQSSGFHKVTTDGTLVLEVDGLCVPGTVDVSAGHCVITGIVIAGSAL